MLMQLAPDAIPCPRCKQLCAVGPTHCNLCGCPLPHVDVYHVIVRTAQALQRVGRHGEASDFMTQAIHQCSSYDDVVALAFGYIGIE